MYVYKLLYWRSKSCMEEAVWRELYGGSLDASNVFACFTNNRKSILSTMMSSFRVKR